MATKYKTKKATDTCYTCGGEREMEETYLRGQLVEQYCLTCEEVAHFPYDDEDDFRP